MLIWVMGGLLLMVAPREARRDHYVFALLLYFLTKESRSNVKNFLVHKVGGNEFQQDQDQKGRADKIFEVAKWRTARKYKLCH